MRMSGCCALRRRYCCIIGVCAAASFTRAIIGTRPAAGWLLATLAEQHRAVVHDERAESRGPRERGERSEERGVVSEKRCGDAQHGGHGDEGVDSNRGCACGERAPGMA